MQCFGWILIHGFDLQRRLYIPFVFMHKMCSKQMHWKQNHDKPVKDETFVKTKVKLRRKVFNLASSAYHSHDNNETMQQCVLKCVSTYANTKVQISFSHDILLRKMESYRQIPRQKYLWKYHQVCLRCISHLQSYCVGLCNFLLSIQITMTWSERFLCAEVKGSSIRHR